MVDSNSTLESLRRKILFYSVIYALAGFLLVAVISIWPLVQLLRTLEEENLLHAARSRALAVEEYLTRVSDVTRQITSRSMMRRYLIRYNRGEIDLEELQDYLEPKMSDALSHSKEAVGIIRLDATGQPVVESGLPITAELKTEARTHYQRSWISDPVVIEDNLYLLSSAPIIDRQGDHVGTDLVLFTTNKLQRIVWDNTGLGATGECLLGRETPDGVVIFFPGRMGEKERYNIRYRQSPLKTAMSRALTQGTGLLRLEEGDLGDIDIVAHTPVHETRWGLLVTMDEQELFGQTNRQLLSVLGILLLLTASGALGIILLLRPLTGKVLVYSSDLETLNRELKEEIEERQRTAENLRRSEKEWEQTFEAITDAVAIMDTRGRVLKMNRATAAFTRSLVPEARSERASQLFFSLDRDNANCPFSRMLDEKQPQSGEIHEPNTDRYFQVSVYPLLDEQSQVWGGVHIAQDITEQKKLNKLKDDMISAVSHEMRTPLTAMLGFVEFLIDNEVDREQQLDFLQTVYKETERLNDLISNFLDLQRLQADIETYHFSSVAPHDLLVETAHLFIMASKKHEIAIDCPADLPPIRADEKRLLQVLKNLVSNAIKYSPDGGQIALSAESADGSVIVSVADQGIGVPPEALRRIFERFYRVDDSEKRIPGGIGLGLTLVREVVRAHGGKIWVESVPGEGSRFSFSVPVWTGGEANSRERDA